MFWSKSQEKTAPDSAPEPSDPKSTASEESPDAVPAAKNAPAPEDEAVASAQSESSWGSRLNTAKQLYSTANQVYTVAQAIPQARATLEPYLASNKDENTKTESSTNPQESTKETAEPTTLAEGDSSDLKSAPVDDVPGSETPSRSQDDSEIHENSESTAKPSSEPAPEGENPSVDTAVEETPASQDTEASKPVLNSESKDEEPAAPPSPSEPVTLETESTNVDTNLESSLSQPEEVTAEDSSSKDGASKGIVDFKDATSEGPRPTDEKETSDTSEKALGSAEDNVVESSPDEGAALSDAASKVTSTRQDIPAESSGRETEDEAQDESGDGLNTAKEKTAKSSSHEDETLKDTSAHGDVPAADSATDTEDEAPVTSEKGLDPKDDDQSIPSKEESVATGTASEPLNDVKEDPKEQTESPSAKSGPEVKDAVGLPEDEESKSVDQIKSPSSSKPDLTPGLDTATKDTPDSKPKSVPANDKMDGTSALPDDPAQGKVSTQSSEDTAAAKAPSQPATADDPSSGPIEMIPAAEKSPDSPSAEAQTGATTEKPADTDGAPPAPATQQPTPEDIEKAAEAAKAAARLQSTADTLWDQARAIRDPAERERLWRAAYNKEIEAHGQSKKARAMASGWGQGALSGVGLSAAVGVGLGNVVGALLGGVVSVPGSLIGAGVGAAMGPLVKLGGYGGKDKKKEQKKERPKEFDWEEDISDDEEHQKIVDAVRLDEATKEAESEDTG